MKKKLILLLCVVVAIMMILPACSSSSKKEEPAASSASSAASSAAAPAEVEIDYGSSELFSQEDIDEAIAVINDRFAEWGEGFTLKNIRFAGDDANSEENIRWINEVAEGQDKDPVYLEVMELLTDFHTPSEFKDVTAWEADQDYTDYQWWFGRTKGGSWELLSTGY